ncbi:MAG: hypothetical protein D6718_04600 [Acidobacteria bacterium]|nr:MAG: hypothetical protein D6718_04600 [Acidobacteriota bacterium]
MAESRTRSRAGSLAGCILALLVVVAPALAGPPPTSCTPAGGVGCDLRSDILVFDEGDPTYEVTAHIVDCHFCGPPNDPNAPPGSFNFRGRAEIQFGPYDPAICPYDQDTLELDISSSDLTPGKGGGGPGGNEPTYVPLDPTERFTPTQPPELKAACVAPEYLDYRIPQVYLYGNKGAVTGAIGSEPNAYLQPPDAFRVEDVNTGELLSRIELDAFRLPQDLTVDTTETYGATSGMRFWPDGLPFRLGPHVTHFQAKTVSFTTPGTAGGGPPAYTPHPPDGSFSTGLQPSQIRGCTDPEPGVVCTAGTIANAGYLESGAWKPSNASCTVHGMSLSLDLDPAGNVIVFETLFPSRFKVRLSDPAHIDIVDGAIAGGWFAGGTLWQGRPPDPCNTAVAPRKHDLETGSLQPQIGADGSLLAGITSLDTNLDPSGVPEIRWARNDARQLGCGTLFVPPALAANDPQRTWHASAVPTVLGRGVYAGINYNRNRVCKASDGTVMPRFCATDADCDTAAGETCVDGGFSPLCPPRAPSDPAPVWDTDIQGTMVSFDIPPDKAGYGDREMAFYSRYSGVTGVFDGGDSGFTTGDGVNTFKLSLSTYGLAFLRSRSEGQDTIVAGDLNLPWPSDTSIPFDGMSICNCGMLDSARSPDTLIERKLAYWDQTFYPYGIQFSSKDSPVECPVPQQNGCADQVSSPAAACVEAVTPVARFDPDIEAYFDVHPNGEAGQIQPTSVARLGFDEDKDPNTGAGTQPPYTFDAEGFAFSDFAAAGAPNHDDVIPPAGSPTADFGYVDARGDLELPYFGLTPVGIRVERERYPGTNHLADLHEECDEVQNPLCAEPGQPAYVAHAVATREMAKSTVQIPFKIDYFTPGETSDPDDGTDEEGRGRGSIFAFADPCDPNDPNNCAIDLGSAKAGTGLIMRPGEIVGGEADLGPAAAMRLWGNVTQPHKSHLESIMPAGIVMPWGSAYDAALTKLGYPGSQGHLLPPPSVLRDQMLSSGAMDDLKDHPNAHTKFNVDGTGTPPVNGSKITGYAAFAPDNSQIDMFLLSSNLDSNGQFFKLDGSLLTVDRHVKEGEEPISEFRRRQTPGASPNVDLPAEQSIPFPPPSTTEANGDDEFMTWELDYDMPGFQFHSLTGTIDLTKGGLSGVGFDELGATLKFFADGNWYFVAGLKVNWSGYGIDGNVLLGNTTDMTPLRDIDPDVADFLEGIDAFDGGFIRCAIQARIFDYGCPFQVSAGVSVGGWYLSSGYGGKVRGWIAGEGACIVSVRGDLTLIGGEINDLFKIVGDFWVGGGIGFCDAESWDKPEDVLDDDWCLSCVAEMTATGTYPPDDLNLQVTGPDFECSP